MLTMNGIETKDVARIGELTAVAFNNSPESANVLAAQAGEALTLLATAYISPALNTIVDFTKRGERLHENMETILSQIAETGELPTSKYTFEKGFDKSSLLDDEVLLMAVFMSIAMRGVNVSSLKNQITQNMSRNRGLHNFAIVSWDDILDVNQSDERMKYLVDQLIKHEKMSELDTSRVHPVLVETREIYRRGDNVEKAAPQIEDYLIRKWETGHLVVGKLPTERKRNMTYGIVLPT